MKCLHSSLAVEICAVCLDDMRIALAAAESKLQECQKYWDDEKRRYDACDKAFQLVCDERDSISSRLDAVRERAEAWSQPQHSTEVQHCGNKLLAILSAVVERHTPESEYCPKCGMAVPLPHKCPRQGD